MDEREWLGKSKMERVHDVSIKAMNMSARKLLGRLMDPPRLSFSQKGFQQDWEGLAELMDLDIDEIQALTGKEEKTFRLIVQWSQKSNSTLGRLTDFLEQLQRYDVLENSILQDRILDDVVMYRMKQECLRTTSSSTNQPIQDDSITSSPISVWPNCSSPMELPIELEFKNITVGEVETGKPEYFDAFVCYSQGDIVFVKQMIQMLEKVHGLKLCVRDRDLTVGSATDTVVAHLIAQRCKKMIIILSPGFLRCTECDFMTKFGHSLGPGARNKKLIPILIQQPCPVPNILRYITQVDYTKCELVEWFWSRLARSLQESSYIDMTTLYGRHLAKQLSVQMQQSNQDARLKEEDQTGQSVTYANEDMSGVQETSESDQQVCYESRQAPPIMINQQAPPIMIGQQAPTTMTAQQALPIMIAQPALPTVAGQQAPPTFTGQQISPAIPDLLLMSANEQAESAAIAAKHKVYIDQRLLNNPSLSCSVQSASLAIPANPVITQNNNQQYMDLQIKAWSTASIDDQLPGPPNMQALPTTHAKPSRGDGHQAYESNISGNISSSSIPGNSAQLLLSKTEEKSVFSRFVNKKDKKPKKSKKGKGKPIAEAETSNTMSENKKFQFF